MREAIPNRNIRPFGNVPISWPANVPRSPVQAFVTVESCYVDFVYASTNVVYGIPVPLSGDSRTLGTIPGDWASDLDEAAITRGTDDVPDRVTIGGKEYGPVPLTLTNITGRPVKGQVVYAFQSQGSWFAFGSYNQLLIGSFKSPGLVYVPGADGSDFGAGGDGYDVWPYTDRLDIVSTASPPAEFTPIVLEWASRDLFLNTGGDPQWDDSGVYIPTWVECSES